MKETNRVIEGRPIRPPQLTDVDHRDQQAFCAQFEHLYGFTPDPETLLDTFGLQLDHLEEILHAVTAYFEAPENPDVLIPVDPPSHGEEMGKTVFPLLRENLPAFFWLAVDRYRDLRDTGELGKDLARDIHKSWSYREDWDDMLAEFRRGEGEQ